MSAKAVTFKLPAEEISIPKRVEKPKETSTAFKVGAVILAILAAASLAGLVCHQVGVLPSNFPYYTGWICAGSFALTAATLLALVLNKTVPTHSLKKPSGTSCAKDVAHIALFIISATALTGIVLSALHMLPSYLPSYFNWIACGAFMLSSSLLLVMHLKDVTNEEGVEKSDKRKVTDLTSKGVRGSRPVFGPEPKTEAACKKALGGTTAKPKYYPDWLSAYNAPRGIAPPTSQIEEPTHPMALTLNHDLFALISECIPPEETCGLATVAPSLKSEAYWWKKCKDAGLPLDLNDATPTYQELYISSFGFFMSEDSHMATAPKKLHAFKPRQVALSSDGKSLITLNTYDDPHQNRTLYVWNQKSNACKQLEAPLDQRHKDTITHFAVSERFIATTSRDKTVKIWDSTTLKIIASFTHTEITTRVAFLENDVMVVGDTHGNAILLKIEEDKLTRLQTIPGTFRGTAKQLIAAGDGFFIAGHQNKRIKYFPNRGDPIDVFKCRSPITATAYQARDGQTKSRRPQLETAKDGTGVVLINEQVKPLNEKLLVIADQEGFLYVLDVSNPQITQVKLKLKFDEAITSLQLKGHTLACGTHMGMTFVLCLQPNYNLDDPLSRLSEKPLLDLRMSHNKDASPVKMRIYKHPDSEDYVEAVTPGHMIAKIHAQIDTLLLRGRSLLAGSHEAADLIEFRFE